MYNFRHRFFRYEYIITWTHQAPTSKIAINGFCNTGWSKGFCARDDYDTESYKWCSKYLSASLQTFIDAGLTQTPSVIPNSNYVIMVVSDWNCLKYFGVFLYCNHQVHRDFLITLYMRWMKGIHGKSCPSVSVSVFCVRNRWIDFSYTRCV
jgi:hypothetical protein